MKLLLKYLSVTCLDEPHCIHLYSTAVPISFFQEFTPPQGADAFQFFGKDETGELIERITSEGPLAGSPSNIMKQVHQNAVDEWSEACMFSYCVRALDSTD